DILVPTTPYNVTAPSHVKLSAYARRADRPDDVRRRLGIGSLDEVRARFRQEFLGECHDAGCATMILSSEHCSSRLLFPDGIARLHDLLSPLGLVEIVVYLRRQAEMWTSHYSTTVKSRSTKPIQLPTPNEKKVLLDYEGLCARWADAFGSDR